MSVKVPLFDPRPQYEALKDELLAAVDRVLSSGKYILGPEVEAFEQEVAEYLGVKHAIGVASGTDALWLSLKALDVGPGDYVLTTPFTFFATASAIFNTGALPVFADIDPRTFNIDPNKVEEALAGKNPVWQRLGIDPKRVKVLLPVHLYGQPADMDELMDIAARYGLRVVEDTAQAMGAGYKGRKAGTIGDLGAFSFFPTKNLGAFGDGGLVATNDDALAGKVRMLRAHGSQRKYHHELIGINSRLDALQAAMLRVKLSHLDQWIEARRRIAARYTQAFQGLDGVMPPYEVPGYRHTYHQYTLRVPSGRRDELRAFLQKQGVGSTVYYPGPVHLQPALVHLGYRPGDFPEAEWACQEVLSLPVFPELREDEVDYVIEQVLAWAEG
ncbi:DegT/DnrJ/EryC1/StrS family aminotransferase [Thermoflexus sp.]|uniref:DegT/DnrJ/EryC1/StrS family aminotransferase n=1 Tax=Thermoflexus sp. TaxID=1969742 RepID=UPI0035E3F8B7